MTQILPHALAYAQQGKPVFPCAARGKVPLTPHGHKDASADPSTVRAWWARHPDANIGLPTGASSGFFALDVDCDAGGEESLRALEARHGALPPSTEVITGAGRHVWFAMPPHATIPCSVGRLGPGLDVRGDGGYVIAPPSVHPSGKAYAWSVDSADSLTPAPQWLLTLIQAQSAPTASPQDWPTLLGAPLHKGARNASLARITGKLLRVGLPPYDALAFAHWFNAQRCVPPMDGAEVTQIVNSIAGRELQRRRARA
jgi:hypothetical protein